VYFGNGCYWARQHTFITKLEQTKLGRGDTALTAITGYAGGRIASNGKSVCYHGAASANSSDYGYLGHAEAVQLLVGGLEDLQLAAQTYFETFVQLPQAPAGAAGSDGNSNDDAASPTTPVWVRADVYDQGAEYRAIIGVPGGLSGSFAPALRAANIHNMTLRVGETGSEPDTFGTNSVFVYDSSLFEFHQAELCMQFHDDQIVKYDAAYHALKEVLMNQTGRLKQTQCPRTNFVCR